MSTRGISMNGRTVDLSYVVNHCELMATEHKMLAAQSGPRRNENLAKAQAADEIAAHFRDAGEGVAPPQEVEGVARQIDPKLYAAYDALMQRLLSEGADEGYAARVAEATYGSELADARAQAAESIANALGVDPAEAGYDKGLSDAIAWHESQAATADRMESIEKTGERKGKYRQRANRHRLYAKRMREDLEAARSIDRERLRIDAERKEPMLPFGRQAGPNVRKEEEGIPLEVQRMFLKKGEVMDDEGFV
jgi:hypothetical protein